MSETPPAGPGIVETARPCRGCGYELRGLSVAGACPECGTPVARSLMGDLLAHASPEYVRSLHRGAVLVLSGVVLDVVLFLATMGLAILVDSGLVPSLTASGVDLSVQIFDFASAGVSLAGWWMLTERDPAHVGPDADARERRWLRTIVGVLAVVAVGSLVLASLPAGVTSDLSALSSNRISITPNTVFTPLLAIALIGRLAIWLLKLAKVFLAILYVRSLALRIPSAGLRRQANHALWVIPLGWTVGWVCLGLGPVAALVYYFVVIEHLRRLLRRVLHAQPAGA